MSSACAGGAAAAGKFSPSRKRPGTAFSESRDRASEMKDRGRHAGRQRPVDRNGRRTARCDCAVVCTEVLDRQRRNGSDHIGVSRNRSPRPGGGLAAKSCGEALPPPTRPAAKSRNSGNKTARGFPPKTPKPRAFFERSIALPLQRRPSPTVRAKECAFIRMVAQLIVFMASSVRFLAPHFSRIVLT